MIGLASKKCVLCGGGDLPLPRDRVSSFLTEVSNWRHVVGGLSENDFILAAKINKIGA